MKSGFWVPSLVFLLFTEPLGAAQRQEITATWAQLREEVASRRLTGHSVTVSLSNGGTVKSTLRRIEENALVVQVTPATEKLWPAVNREARIPRAEVTALGFTGRQGRGGMIGGLVGLGAGAGAAAAVATTGASGEGVSGAGAIILIPVLAVGGYFIGRSLDKPLPRFRIVP